jgi:hypothetical protein
MAMAAAHVTTETVGAAIAQPMERNENGTRTRRSEHLAPAVAPSNCRCRMEKTMRQQAHELTQLHQTIEYIIHQLEAQAARKKALWQGMMTWMQERERKWDTPREDDGLVGRPSHT